MKWIKSNTVQNIFALWLAYLMFLIVMHVVGPDDPWNQVFFRPAFMIVVPILAGCIPLVGTKPESSRVEEDLVDENGWDRPRKAKWIDSDVARRMAVVWIASLVIFASPHGIRAAFEDPIVHRPIFLLVAPLLLACASLSVPWTIPVRSEVVQTPRSVSRSRVWQGLVSAILMLPILVLFVIMINGMQSSMSALWPNLCLAGCLVGDLMAIRRFVRLQRATR